MPMPSVSAGRPFLKRSDQGEALWFLGGLVTVKASAEDTRGQVTVVEFVNPAGFAPPLHRHQAEDEMFYILDGVATFHCDGATFDAGPGDFVLLPVGLPHTFVVGAEAPLRTLQITTPAGFEQFAAAAGHPAAQRRLPDPAAPDVAVLARAAGAAGIELLGPPATPAT
jgi:mannose-6-phosphate isomerase-like protein (cupin superfamily)